MRALALLLLLAGCKDKSAPAPPSPPSPPSPPAPAPAPPAAAPAPPALPTDAAAAVAPAPLTTDEVVAQLPRLAGDAMLPVKTTADGLQAHGTWCLAGTSADAVAGSLAATMTAAGYDNVATRGDAQKAGVSGERGPWRLSYVVSASTAANCRAPGHYLASVTVFRSR